MPHPLASSLVRSAVNLGFQSFSERRAAVLGREHPATVQERRVLPALIHAARKTRFGRDHGFGAIRTIADFQRAIPLRTYEDLWKSYLRDQYPIFDNLTWPGRIPYLALTSGTTQGATKFIPVSREMLASNRRAGLSLIALHMANRAGSNIFKGRVFFLGGSTDLEQPAPGVWQGDLSGIAVKELNPLLRPYTFPPLELALESDWDRKLRLLAERSLNEKITLLGGVPSWLLLLFERLRELSGKATIAEIWPELEVVVHGGVKFDPYRAAFVEAIGDPGVKFQDSYACSEGFLAVGDPATGLLRLLFDHGIFYEFVPVDELDSPTPTRHWMGNVETGVNYAIVVSTCAGLWGHIIGDTVRFESLAPPLITFTGRTKYTLSAFGEHLISEELESAIAAASAATGASVRDWHVGPVFEGTMGHHAYIIEFLKPPDDLKSFRSILDGELLSRNADYKAHRSEGVGMPLPAIVVSRPGGFDAWMRSKGKLGGQHKVPRMDNSGVQTAEIAETIRSGGWLDRTIAAGGE